MARAYLHLSNDITEAFLSAQDDLNIRFLKISIANESLILDATISSQSTIEQDFNNILPTIVRLNEACFIIFRLYDGLKEYNRNWSKNSWLLITWIPDNCRVRDKMLYSSSKEDLKNGLGLGYFISEYSISQFEDIQWNLLRAYLSKDDEALLSEKEIMIKEEKVLSHKESHQIKSSAMGLLPMEISSDNILILSEFNANSCNWIEITVIKEAVHITSKLIVKGDQKFSELINNDEPRFYLTKLFKKGTNEFMTIFVYSCPENSSIKLKMTSSSSKATILYILKQNDINVNKTIEVRESDEVNDLINSELNDLNVSENLSGSNSNSSFTAGAVHSKPVRPGRGKAKVSKFEDS